MKKIIILYWVELNTIEGLIHKSEYEYSKEKRNEIIDQVFASGNAVMIKQSGENVIIYIDKYRFGQR